MSMLNMLDVVPVILETGADGKVMCECGCGGRYQRSECVVVASGVSYQARYNVLHRSCAIIAWGEKQTSGFHPATDPYIYLPVGTPRNVQFNQRSLPPHAGG